MPDAAGRRVPTMTGRSSAPSCGPFGPDPHRLDERGYCAGCTGLFTTGRSRTADDLRDLLGFIRILHRPYAGKPCKTCLVPDGYAKCATADAIDKAMSDDASPVRPPD